VGSNPITGDAIAPATSTNPTENPINGHEYLIPGLNDLQYACTFPLPTPRDCSSGMGACDCGPQDQAFNRPLCNPPGGGPSGTNQYYGKAYPGVRHLQVVKGLGPRGNLASICPRTTSGDPGDPDFGYNPAVDAITRQIAAGLGSTCLSEPLDENVTASLSCRVIELGQGVCDCGLAGRRDLPASTQAAVAEELGALCQERGVNCDDYCACEITPLEGAELTGCQTELSPAAGDGWCYIDPGQGVGSADLVDHCSDASAHVVRIVGAPTQASATELRLLCDL
jgi:hypothetical protein